MDLSNKKGYSMMFNYFDDMLKWSVNAYKRTPCEYYEENIQYYRKRRDQYLNLLSI